MSNTHEDTFEVPIEQESTLTYPVPKLPDGRFMLSGINRPVLETLWKEQRIAPDSLHLAPEDFTLFDNALGTDSSHPGMSSIAIHPYPFLNRSIAESFDVVADEMVMPGTMVFHYRKDGV